MQDACRKELANYNTVNYGLNKKNLPYRTGFCQITSTSEQHTWKVCVEVLVIYTVEHR